MIAAGVGGSFPPGRLFFALGPENHSPILLEKIVYFGGNSHSFEDAERNVRMGLDMDVSARQIETLTERAGRELADQRDHLARLWEARQLPEPTVQNAPQAVAVAVDDGKVHTRAQDAPPGVHDPQWKNHKTACLMRLVPQQHSADPMPQPPAAFTNRPHLERLVAQLGHVRSGPKADSSPPGQTARAGQSAKRRKRKEAQSPASPQLLVRSCVLTHTRPDTFGAMVAAEAHMRRFFEAPCGAFLGDGCAGNWTIQDLYFPNLMPVLDFVHLIEHLWAACRDLSRRIDWKLYLRLVRSAWAGKPKRVLRILHARARCLGPPPEGADEEDPREVLRKAIGYVQSNRERMDYPRARRLGLPVTTSHVESLINTVNIRVKASGKFWCPDNVEAVLQVRAASLSETNRWESFWNTRAQKHAGRIRAPRRPPP